MQYVSNTDIERLGRPKNKWIFSFAAEKINSPEYAFEYIIGTSSYLDFFMLCWAAVGHPDNDLWMF